MSILHIFKEATENWQKCNNCYGNWPTGGLARGKKNTSKVSGSCTCAGEDKKNENLHCTEKII
jgi:hypothetical protein